MDTDKLKKLVEENKSIKQISKEFGKGQTTIRYWLSKLGLKTNCRVEGKYTKDKLENAVKKSTSYSGVLNNLGILVAGNIYYHIKSKIKKYGINTSHFCKQSFFGNKNKLTANEILTNNKKRRENSKRLTRALKEMGVEYKCEECGLEGVWKNKKLVLPVDHRNGDWSDCRFENVRFLCPNCHSQTETFCGRGRKKKCKCGVKISSKSIHCMRCNAVNQGKHLRRANRPPYEQLKKEIENSGYVQVGKKYGVTDNSIRKWCKYYEKHGINTI
jgi:hypothetical protein